MKSHRWNLVMAALLSLWVSTTLSAQAPRVLFEEDFEDGLDGWFFPNGSGQEVVPSGDPAHGFVLRLQTRDRVGLALIRGSESWEGVRLEGEVLFPTDVHNYLGFVYRYSDVDGRKDFGSLYIKGNGSYIRVNPHRDLNVGRTMYEEFRTPLTDDAAIEIGSWQRFALEVVGGEAHLYVGDMGTPQITYPFWNTERGAFGFKPRNPGGAVWVDALRATAIEGFTYRGPPRPNPAYDPADLVTQWDVLGPLTRFYPDVEMNPFDADLTLQDGDRTVGWTPFETDRRGAVLTSKITDHEGPRRVAYLHATVVSDGEMEVPLGLSSVDHLSIWVNGQFEGFFYGELAAWWDFRTNEDHAVDEGTVTLVDGENHILVRVVGGMYATGGFYLSLAPGRD